MLSHFNGVTTITSHTDSSSHIAVNRKIANTDESRLLHNTNSLQMETTDRIHDVEMFHTSLSSLPTASANVPMASYKILRFRLCPSQQRPSNPKQLCEIRSIDTDIMESTTAEGELLSSSNQLMTHIRHDSLSFLKILEINSKGFRIQETSRCRHYAENFLQMSMFLQK